MGLDRLGCVHGGFFAGAVEMGAVWGKIGSRSLFCYRAYCGNGHPGGYGWPSWSWTRRGVDWDEYCAWSIDWSGSWPVGGVLYHNYGYLAVFISAYAVRTPL